MAKMMIKANVGRRPHRDCMNLKSDQITVMTLLNAIPEALGGTAGPGLKELEPRLKCSDCGAKDVQMMILHPPAKR